MSAIASSTRYIYVSGGLIEFWEDPDHPFGCAEADLQRYLDREAWVLLFNALTLTARAQASEADA
jgi:hypothetical protein